MKPSLDVLREDMRKKDREIIRLLNERSQISVQIGQVKGQTGLEVYNPAQEARVFNYLQELNGGLRAFSTKWRRVPWSGASCPWKIHWKGR